MRKTVRDLLCFKINFIRKGRCKMKKRITALLLAASTLLTTSAFAATVTFDSMGSQRAVITCFDKDAKLVYARLAKSEDGKFTEEIPAQYNGFVKKAYIIGAGKSIELTDIMPTDEPVNTPEPTVTDKPEATVKPDATSKPSKREYPPIYEKEADAIYGMALVKDVGTDINSSNETIYSLTLFYNGKEITVGIDENLQLSSAPDAYPELKGQDVGTLKRGDVICMTASISGDKIRTVDLLFRPTDEDIATGSVNYGSDFEKLFTQNGKVAGKWNYMKYTERPSSDRYNYVFGIVAERNPGSLILINKNAMEEETIDLDIRKDTLVYTCDVYGREYTVEASDIYGIETSLPSNMFDRDEPFTLDKDYTYNYALARVVDGITTEIILFNNYNE